MSKQNGDVTLILRRAEALYNLYGVLTDCVVLNRRLAGREIGHASKGIAFYQADRKDELAPRLKSGDYGTVIFYGEVAQLAIPYVRRLTLGRVKILIDVQGVVEEQIEYSEKSKLPANYVKFLVKRLIFRRAARLADGMLVVSDEMREYCLSYLGRKKKDEIRFFKIRCGAGALIPESHRLAWRREVRRGWGISDTTVVMVFSGSRAPWQKTDDIIEFFRRCDRIGHDVFFAFFCSADGDFPEKLAASFPRKNFTLEYLPFEKLAAHLCACDIGFLVRDRNTTNRVAFPNKFSDYISAGLLVAMDNTLPEPARVLAESGLTPVSVRDTPEEILTTAGKRRENLSEYYRQCDQLCWEELLYERQIEKSGIVTLLEN